MRHKRSFRAAAIGTAAWVLVVLSVLGAPSAGKDVPAPDVKDATDISAMYSRLTDAFGRGDAASVTDCLCRDAFLSIELAPEEASGLRLRLDGDG